VEEIRTFIGADSLGYLSLEGLLMACGADEDQPRFCTACYTSKYPIEVSSEIKQRCSAVASKDAST
jgi:amidophosphoribosyltransferase